MNPVEQVLPVQNQLGEGPVWSPAQQTLYWVDIKEKRLFRYYPAIHKYEVFQLTTPIMALAVRRSSKELVTACGMGFAFWSPDTNTFTPIRDPEADKPQTRFNDGGVDPRGRFLAGTMNESDPMTGDGSLYRLDSDLSIHRLESGITVSNGIAWTADHRTMYFTDTLRYAIFAYDYDVETGSIRNRRVFVEIPQNEGVPDGLTIDSEGYVYSALYYGGKVLRFAPDGKRDGEIKVPSPNATSVAFGGANLDTLYITTAWLGLDEAKRKANPLAGDLFCVQMDVRGVEEPMFAG